RGRIGAEVMTGDDLRRYGELANERAETKPERLHAHEVELASQQPACIVFAKSGGLYQRLGFIRVGVGFERRFRFRKHVHPGIVSMRWNAWRSALVPHAHSIACIIRRLGRVLTRPNIASAVEKALGLAKGSTQPTARPSLLLQDELAAIV